MKKILDYPNGPIFLRGRWGDIRLKVWHGKRAKYVRLTAQSARTLAYALLLEAEKLEASQVSPPSSERIGRYTDRAIDALLRFHAADTKLRKRMQEREFREYLKR